MAGDLHHPVFARVYARAARAMERAGAGEHRARLVAGLSGRVVEVGAGTGAGFAHYPPAVREVLAVEPEPRLRALAERAAASAPVPVTVTAGLAEHLPVGDGAVDAAVCSLVLCSVPDQAAALRELRRVLRPGGRLHVWEHVRSAGRAGARLQDALDATVWPRLAGGCHTGRDTAAAIAAAGFVVQSADRFRWPAGPPCPTGNHVLLTALRP